ncbi:MAG: hypothetical protein K2J71_10365 [Oscillospiraceae bacterium]|nr:hypothetical protein [Oscillospiraceae bacterium]
MMKVVHCKWEIESVAGVEKTGKVDIPLMILFIILFLVVGVTGFVIFRIVRPQSRDEFLHYFQEHQPEFVRIAEYFEKNPDLLFSVCDGDLQDLDLLDSPDLQNTIRSMLNDGIIFEIRNVSGQDAEILFIANDLLIRNQETIAIVYADQMPKSEISYKGDSVEYSNQFESLGDNWYRKYRES